MICKICDRQIGNKGFSSHLRNTHKISNQEYYDMYIGITDEKTCYCGKPNSFLGIPYGYSKHCSVKCSMNDPKTTEKRINTNLKVFGTENPFQNEDIKKVIHSKICNKFGGMGASSEKIRQKMYKSLRTDGKITYEQQIFEQLLKIYPNCKHDYKTKLYPYKCDFYIPEEDLYIELNLYWMHGGHWFDKTNKDDLQLLEIWKHNNSKAYNYAIEIWTKKDLEKLNCAIKNNLNYKVFWSKKEIEDYIQERAI